MGAAAREHWDAVYRRDRTRLSWHQEEAQVSLELIATLDLPRNAPIIDIGGGDSPLAAGLVARGQRDVSVLDIAATALEAARSELGAPAQRVTWICADVLSWQPARSYELWHDRAALHFILEPRDRRRYAGLVRRALAPGGHVVIGGFAPDGPISCSGLPVVRAGPDELAELLGSDFNVRETRREIHHTPGGSRQPFTWIVARRGGPAD
jgi:hypothetical protein